MAMIVYIMIVIVIIVVIFQPNLAVINLVRNGLILFYITYFFVLKSVVGVYEE